MRSVIVKPPNQFTVEEEILEVFVRVNSGGAGSPEIRSTDDESLRSKWNDIQPELYHCREEVSSARPFGITRDDAKSLLPC